jgi:polyhydroxyalkanoate synthase
MSWHFGQTDTTTPPPAGDYNAGNPFNFPFPTPGSTGPGGTRPLAAMAAAVLAASQKPLAEQALKQLLSSIETIPADINWLQFKAGLMRHSSQPPRAPRPVYPQLGQVGRVTLHSAGGSGPPVVIIPSMVNRGYVLDLLPNNPNHSLIAALRQAGHQVLFISWNDPALADAPLTLSQLVTERLEPLLHLAHQQVGPMAVFGYCMGGLLALAGAVRVGPQVVSQLAVAAMPWDFANTASAAHVQHGLPMLQPWLASQTLLPAHVMAHYFWLLDPWGPIRRLMAYGQETDPARLQFLTALEDWLTDGLALDAPIAKEMLVDWYAHNAPLNGQWRIGGTAITPQNLNVPLWVGITQNDNLVPLNAALPFIGQAKGASVVMVPTGHIGLVCGRQAAPLFYQPLSQWLKSTQTAAT